MTRVLHTARISSVDSIMFVNGIRTKKSTEEKNEKNMVEQRSAESEGLRFDSSCTTLKNFFCPTLVTRRKPSLSISLPSSKLTLSLILLKVKLIDLGYR